MENGFFSFPRLCAVFGGVYCLKRSITDIYFTDVDEKLVFDAIQCDKQKIQGKDIVFGHGTISGARFEKATGTDILTKENISRTGSDRCGNICRGIFITDTPIGDESLNSGGGGVIFLKMPSTSGNSSGAFVMQLSHWSGCCPKGFCKSLRRCSFFSLNSTITSVDLIHITGQSTGASGTSAKDDLAPYVEKLFKSYDWQEPDKVTTDESNQTEVAAPRMLWSMYCNIPTCLKCEYADETPIPGLHLSCGPYFELDYDRSIADVS